tara:strand:- start:12859 stop:14472 length:1614 start_codon:yes stop_codon:yes gene_type:complete
MATSITYGSYSFPEPIPLFSEEDEAVKLGGLLDHSTIRVNIVGFLTGSDLSGLDLQKMQMVSGFLNEYQDLTITIENEAKTCPCSFIESIDFNESDSTTVLPYSLTALYYSGETFSEYFGVTDPQNSWSYEEGDNKIITATHSVSAKGLKVNTKDPFDNAREFVSGKVINGFENIALFNSGDNAFLTSRTENVDRKENIYGVTEVYSYSAGDRDNSDRSYSDSGVLSLSTSISFSNNSELSISVDGSLQGSIDANTGSQVGLLSTGNFTPEQATDVATNALVNSYSDYESGIYSFVQGGPTAFNYDLNTGANLLNFSFTFADPDKVDVINNNVLHSYVSSISLSKDSSVSTVQLNGNLKYLGSLFIDSTGEFENNARFQAVETAFGQVDQQAIATSALQKFSGVATGYEINSSYINEEPRSLSISKNPVENTISYNYNYSNQVDFSSGNLKDLTLTIQDKKPLAVNNVQETIGGFKASQIISRSLGNYSVSANCSNDGAKLQNLKEFTSGLCSGDFVIEDSYSTGQNTISYNLSKYY